MSREKFYLKGRESTADMEIGHEFGGEGHERGKALPKVTRLPHHRYPVAPDRLAHFGVCVQHVEQREVGC